MYRVTYEFQGKVTTDECEVLIVKYQNTKLGIKKMCKFGLDRCCMVVPMEHILKVEKRVKYLTLDEAYNLGIDLEKGCAYKINPATNEYEMISSYKYMDITELIKEV